MSLNPYRWQDVLPFFSSQLFITVQEAGLFADSKTFADVSVKTNWQDAIAAFEAKRDQDGFDLQQFIDTHFDIPGPVAPLQNVDRSNPIEYVNSMWQALTRAPDTQTNTSLIPLSRPYIVPGGRFREIYYWDTYFTALGLMDAGHSETVVHLLENFVDIIEEVGCIPNGNRAYYHTRSQPPVMALLYNLVADELTDAQRTRVAAGLRTEHAFWIRGSEQLSVVSPTYGRVVRMPDGSVLNRYYDDADTPRPESWREDIETARKVGAQSADFYRHIRAACESGWDFSSRWLADPMDLASIRTTEIVPVDLNSLLVVLEQTLARLATTQAEAEDYQQRATARCQAIDTFLFCEDCYYDYHLPSSQITGVISAAATLPLFVGIASAKQATVVSQKVSDDLLQPGGIVTTALKTGQQWDSPNGWAPLQYFAAQGLSCYGFGKLAREIMQRFVSTIEFQFTEQGVMLEKYDVCEPHKQAGGGEYEVQLGFGWTNGVYQRFTRLLNE